MKFLTTNDRSIDANDPSSIGEYVYEYDVEKEDWMLRQRVLWDKIISDVYTFRLGSYRFKIPSGIYIYTGDYGGCMDWIISDEIIGRDLEVYIMPTSLTSWNLEKPVLESVTTDATFFMPSVKTPLAYVDQSGTKTIFASVNDQYHAMKNNSFSTMFVI